jgi:hypothetical protein
MLRVPAVALRDSEHSMRHHEESMALMMRHHKESMHHQESVCHQESMRHEESMHASGEHAS